VNGESATRQRVPGDCLKHARSGSGFQPSGRTKRAAVAAGPAAAKGGQWPLSFVIKIEGVAVAGTPEERDFSGLPGG
jgi:hypothetical protein